MATDAWSKIARRLSSLGASLSFDAASWARRVAAGIWLVLCFGATWALTWHARPGADFKRYEAWSNVLYSSDIFQLDSVVGSPLGLPLSVHSAGPGMLLSVGRSWFGQAPIIADSAQAAAQGASENSVRPDFLLLGLVALCAWWLFLRLLLRITAGNMAITALVGGIAFVGTHLGFYSGTYSSELASFFALSLLYYFAFGTERIGLFEAILVGVASGLAVLIRTQLVMYLALPWAGAAYRVYGRSKLSERSLLLLVAALVPCLVLLVEAGYVNRWMTGSFLRTPYQFGDEDWQSVDLHRPEFGAVLLHVRHGLLRYHPLYLVLCGSCLYLLATARDWTERALCVGALAIFGLHLYLQAAWFCWWLGTETFGMRGMLTTAVVLIPPLAVVLARRQRAGRAIWPLVLLCAACSLWSFLLYLQGKTNFNDWSQMWDSQVDTFHQDGVFLPAACALGAAVVLRALLWRKRAAGIAAAAAAAIGVAMLAALDFWVQEDLVKADAAAHPHVRVRITRHAAELAAEARAHLSAHLSMPKEMAWYLAGAIAFVTVFAFAALLLNPQARAPWRWTERVLGGFALAVVVSGSMQFRQLVVTTEAYLRDPKPDEHPYKFINSTVLWDEICASYREYHAIPGFEEPKGRFHDYLERHRGDWSFVRADRHKRHRRPRRHKH